MAWWKKLFGLGDQGDRVDYYDEGLDLLAEGKYHEALTSFRLALKEAPGDSIVLQQIAIAYTRIGMTEEAAKTYRHVLQKEPGSSGAHYGLAFLLVRSGKIEEAIPHLEAFLADPPEGPEADEHIAHARATLTRLTEGGEGTAAGPEDTSSSREAAPPNELF